MDEEVRSQVSSEFVEEEKPQELTSQFTSEQSSTAAPDARISSSNNRARSQEDSGEFQKQSAPSNAGTDKRSTAWASQDTGYDHVATQELVPALHITEEQENAITSSWEMFLIKAGSREEAGELLHWALTGAIPVLQGLFQTPQALQALRFVSAFEGLVKSVSDTQSLQLLVEKLGFMHFSFDVSPKRNAAFRDGILELMETELNTEFSELARNSWSSLLDYVGEGLMTVRGCYSARLQLLSDSWASIVEGGDRGSGVNGSTMKQGNDTMGSLEFLRKSSDASFDAASPKLKKDSSFEQSNTSGEEGSKASSERGTGKKKDNRANMPTTFGDMFSINAAVMGLSGASTWMKEPIAQFDNIVRNADNASRLEEEAHILALRLVLLKEKEEIKLDGFKSCMLASLRSMLPRTWTTAHEVAWSWLWNYLADILQSELKTIVLYEKALHGLMERLHEDDAYQMRKAIYAKFFKVAPAGQEYLKQSNTRLHFILHRIFRMTFEIFHCPAKMVQEISALGLRHVGFGIPIDLFSPHTTCIVEVLAETVQDTRVLDAFRWSIGLVAKILMRTISEGSTVVMKAINANSTKQLLKAVAFCPRGQRAISCLLVQVGTESISPLSWAIESGRIDVARSILNDLLTIRADRERYYYGANELFARHPDIVKRLAQQASMLLPTLLEGLVWRSHRPKNNLRRVNYYVEHLLISQRGDSSDGLKHIVSMHDPGIMADPVVVIVSDRLWSGVVLKQFAVSKIGGIISLLVFMLAQGILPRASVSVEPDRKTLMMWTIFVGKLFNYICGMGRIGLMLWLAVYRWSRRELQRIFDEIDQDGSGTIDYEEFMRAMTEFKNAIAAKIKAAVDAFKDDATVAAATDDGKNTISNKDNSMTNFFQSVLFITLVAMCSHEPMLWCVNSPDFPTLECDEAQSYHFRYSVFSMCSMILHWLVLADLAVLSTEISAFLLVIGHVLHEVKQFLTALLFLLLMFGSALAIMCRDCTDEAGDFSDVLNAMVSLFAITVRLYQGDFRDIMGHPLILFVVMLCTTFSAILLMNLLVAQLNLSYEFIYTDMLGFARHNRSKLICEVMVNVSKSRWELFKKSLSFDENLEFDEGDLGLCGGIQMLEPASLHRVHEEAIRRYGGTTSPEAPWPHDHRKKGGVDALLDKIERTIYTACRSVQRRGSGCRGNNSSSGQRGVRNSEGSSSMASFGTSISSSQ